MSLSVQAPFSFSYETLISSNLHKLKLKITWKEKQKPTLQRMKNWTKSYLCMIVPIFSENPAFYRQKLRGERCEKIWGANAPPNSLTKPRKRGFCRILTARVWPGGHTLLVVLLNFSICIYLQLDLQFKSGILTKWPLILGFNRSICRDLF